MTRVCEVCRHPQLDEINEDLSPVRDMTAQAVVDKYGGISIDSVRRHKMNHLIPAFRRDMAIQTRAEAFTARTDSLRLLAEKMGEVVAYAEEVRDQAHASGDKKLVLQANAEVRATLVAVGKFVGMQTAPIASTEELEAARALILALRVVMPLFPEAFNSLVVELQAQNQFDLAVRLESYVNRRKG